jgi:hypothetical protein
MRTLAVALLFSAVPAAAQITSQYGRQYYCYASISGATGRLPSGGKPTLYVTPIRDFDGAPLADIRDAWVAYVAANLDKLAQPACDMSVPEGIKSMRENNIKHWSFGQVIDPKWEYKRSMTAMPSKIGALYGWCASGQFAGDKIEYFSPVFEIPMADATDNQRPVEVTFAAFINRQYKLGKSSNQWQSSYVGCPHNYANRQDAENYRQNTMKEMRAKGMRTVETTWMYARNADTPPSRPNSVLSH